MCHNSVTVILYHQQMLIYFCSKALATLVDQTKYFLKIVAIPFYYHQ